MKKLISGGGCDKFYWAVTHFNPCAIFHSWTCGYFNLKLIVVNIPIKFV